MCLSSVDELIAALHDLKDARETLDRVSVPGLVQIGSDFEVTVEEAQHLAQRRIERLEARCRELGCHGPAPKADRGDSTRIVSAK